MTNLNTFDQIIMSSLAESPKDLLELYEQTDLPRRALINCLKDMLESKMIKIENGRYQANICLEGLRDSKELFQLLKDMLGKGISVKKIGLDPAQIYQLEKLFLQIDKFIESCQKQNKNRSGVEMQSVVWGQVNIKQMVHHLLDELSS